MGEIHSLVDFASDAALAINGEAHVVAWNERAARLLGYTLEEVLDQPCGRILQATLPNGGPLCSPECEGKRCFDQRAPFGVSDCRVRHKDGRWLRAMISTLVAPAPRKDHAFLPVLAILLLRLREEKPFIASTHGQLRVSTFGRFSLSAHGRDLPIERWYRRHALTLLKILVTNRREALHREHLIAHLWPDADERRGRERLKVTTYFLREQLCAAGVTRDIINVIGPAYALKRESVWLDCESFEQFYEEGRRLTRCGRQKDALRSFNEAVRLYRGDYLAEDLYAEWCAEERQRLRETYFDILGHIIDSHLDRGDFVEAAVVCRRGLADEPCREGFHRALMICLARLGQCDRLAAHYDNCRKVLKAELGVGPTPETERLYRELVAGGTAGRSGSNLRH